MKEISESSFEEFLEFLKSPKLQDFQKIDLIKAWSDKEGGNFDIKKLQNLLGLVQSDYRKSSLIKYWLKKPANNFDVEKLQNLLEFVQDASFKKSIIKAWLKKPEPENNFDVEKLLNLLGLVRSISDKSSLIESWFKKPGNNFDVEKLQNLLGLVQNDVEKRFLIESWFEKPANNFDVEKLQNLLGLVQKDVVKRTLIESWLKKPGNNFDIDKLESLLELMQDNRRKGPMIISWLEKPEPENNFDVEKLQNLLGLVQNEGDLITSWFKSNPTYENFCTLVKNGMLCGSDDYKTIATKFLELEIETEGFTKLCKDLYPNKELLQTELFTAFIGKQFLNQKYDPNKIKQDSLLFIKNLTDDQGAFESLKAIKTILRLTKEEIIETGINGDHLTELLEGIDVFKEFSINIKKEAPRLLMWFCDGSKNPDKLPIPTSVKGNYLMISHHDRLNVSYYETLKNSCESAKISKTPIYLCYHGGMINDEQKQSMEALAENKDFNNLYVIDYEEFTKQYSDRMENIDSIFNDKISDSVSKFVRKEQADSNESGHIVHIVDSARMYLVYRCDALKSYLEDKYPKDKFPDKPIIEDGILYHDFDVSMKKIEDIILKEESDGFLCASDTFGDSIENSIVGVNRPNHPILSLAIERCCNPNASEYVYYEYVNAIKDFFSKSSYNPAKEFSKNYSTNSVVAQDKSWDAEQVYQKTLQPPKTIAITGQQRLIRGDRSDPNCCVIS